MNSEFNNDLARGQWGLDDGIIVSDCGAVGDEASTAYVNGTAEMQVTAAVNGGCDYNCGSMYRSHLAAALSAGTINDSAVDRAASRLLRKTFELGLFDPIGSVPFARYGPERLGQNSELALEGATQSIVLLKNDAAAGSNSPLLPLAPGAKVALIGPHLNVSVDMLSNYHGDNLDVHNHTPLLALSRRGAVVGHATGSGLFGNDTSGFADAAALASKADVALVFVGLHPQWFDDAPVDDSSEGEARDREDILLPAVQRQLIKAICATGVPVVLVLINGGQVAIPWAKQHVPSIVESFYPGQRAVPLRNGRISSRRPPIHVPPS